MIQYFGKVPFDSVTALFFFRGRQRSETDMVLVLIRTESNSVYRFQSISGLPAVDIDSSGIDGSSNVIEPIAEIYPGLLDYERIYLVEGSYPQSFPVGPAVLAALIAAALLFYNLLPLTVFGQKLTRTGKEIDARGRLYNLNVGLKREDAEYIAAFILDRSGAGHQTGTIRL